MMRNFLIAAATAASALAVAAPASAQYYPQPRGNAYGYNNYGGVRSLQARLDNIERQIDRLDRRNILSNKEARRLREDARDLERRIYRVGRNGLNPMERQNLEYRIQRLEQKVMRDANDGRNGWNRRY
jgi:predicted RNase H-like nuclease (RuvC/YqgF family)